MVSFSCGDYRRQAAIKITAYCGCCHRETAHWFNQFQSTVKRNAYTCGTCLHLVMQDVVDAPDLKAWVIYIETAATMARLTAALDIIADFALGNGDACETCKIIVRQARAALNPQEPK